MTSQSAPKIDELVGANVRSLRQERGLSESECAAALRLGIVEYRECEAGVRRLSAGQLMTVAEKLRVSLARLYANTTPETLRAAVMRDAADTGKRRSKALR